MIQKEFLTRSLVEELKPLISEHHTEIEKNEEEVNVDWLAYQVLQENNLFYFYTARAKGELLGYLGYIVTHNLHYRNHKYALCDLIYVSPQYRGKFLAVKLLKHAEVELSKLGVRDICQPVRVDHDFGPILKRQGYKIEEYNYGKRIH